MKYPRRSSTESYQMWGLLIFNKLTRVLLQIDTDHSDTIDFNEFVKIMTWSVLIMRIKRKTRIWLYWLWLWLITVWYHIMEYWADHLTPSSTCRCDAAADLTLEVSWTQDILSIFQQQSWQRTTYNRRGRRSRKRMVLGLYKVVRGWLVWKLCKV